MTATYSDRIGGAQSSLAIKAPVVAATTANITLSGLQTIDGVALAAGDRVLVQAQTNAVMNGIWVASALEWSRAKDFNGARDVAQGTFMLVAGGTISANSIFILTTEDPVIGSSALAFTREFVTSAAAEAWARSPTAPDPEDPTSKSAKTWAEIAGVSATLAVDAQENLFDAFRGAWQTATAYIVGDLARDSGTTYICIIAHTSGTFVTDLGLGRWAPFAAKGDAGVGTGDVVAANNGSEFDPAEFKATLGFGAAASLGTSTDPDFAGVAPTSLAPRSAIDAFVDAAVAESRTRGGAVAATTSGTAFDYTGIPTGVQQIEVLLNGVSLNGTDNLLIQIGGSGGFAVSGYTSVGTVSSNGGNTSGTSNAGFFIVFAGAANALTGMVTLSRIAPGSNVWLCSGAGSRNADASWTSGGSLNLGSELDRVRITRTGTNTFDAGEVNVRWK